MAVTRALQNELVSLGARPVFTPSIASARPFQFTYLVTDNATTASDLTATSTSCTDAELNFNYGATGDNPQIVMQIEAISADLDVLDETSIICQELSSRLYLYHQAAGGRSQYINLGQFLKWSSYGSAYDASAAAVMNTNRPDPLVYTLPSPWIVNFNTDQLSVAPIAAVNTAGGNLTGGIVFYGFAWSVPQGMPSQIECPSSQQAASLGLGLRAIPEVTR
jgi:hypothetical protein